MLGSSAVFDRGEELYTREEMHAERDDYELSMAMACHNASRSEVLAGTAPYEVYRDVVAVGSWSGYLSRDPQKELVSLIESWVLPAETWDLLVSDAVGGSTVRSTVAKAGSRAGSAESILIAWHGTFKDVLQGTGRRGPALSDQDLEKVEKLLRGEDLDVKRAVGGLLFSWPGTLEDLIYASREAVKLGRSPAIGEGEASAKTDNPGRGAGFGQSI